MLEELKKIRAEIVAIDQAMSSFNMLRERLQKDFNLNGVKASLLSFPCAIEEKQRQAQQRRKQIPDIEAELKSIEAELAYGISLETNGAEKPKSLFPNADARKAELIKRLRDNKQYTAFKKDRVSLEFELVNLEFEIDKLRNSFRANLAIKDLIVAEMNIYRS